MAIEKDLSSRIGCEDVDAVVNTSLSCFFGATSDTFHVHVSSVSRSNGEKIAPAATSRYWAIATRAAADSAVIRRRTGTTITGCGTRLRAVAIPQRSR
jgi:hypothetical protein